MLANLLVMGWFGWFRPVEAGQLVFGLAVVTLGLAPAAAVVLLIWPLIRWGRGLMKIARILVLLGLAILMVRPYSTAFSNELGAALQSPPPVTADSGGGHC
jgi:hypothetical protein